MTAADVHSQRLAEFRAETREWLQANCPPSCRGKQPPQQRVYPGKQIDFPSADAKLWFERMVEKGWCMPGYPKRYGGADLGPEECQILKEEMRELECFEPQISLGIIMVAPVLLEFGSEEQKAEFLPRIARGEMRWCQGYSEPGAGSDLASLRTRAEDHGDHYLVTGSKIWTTDGHKSDWMYCLVRTDFNAPKQRGITFLLFDMDQPGVDARPIRMISGNSHFSEVFLDRVRAEKAHRIGEENQGWTVAKRLLQHERAMMSATGGGKRGSLVRVAERCLQWREGRVADPALRARLSAHMINRAALDLLGRRCAEEQARGIQSHAGLGLKYAGTEEEKRRQTLHMDMLGHRGLGWEDQASYADEELRAAPEWMLSKALTIAGGSSEIQLNVISRRALHLPSE